MQVVLEMDKPKNCGNCSLCYKGMCIPKRKAVPDIAFVASWCPLKNEGLTKSAELLKRLSDAVRTETSNGLKVKHSADVIFRLNDAGAFFKQQKEIYFIIIDEKTNNMIGLCCLDQIDTFCEEYPYIKLIKLNKNEYFDFCSKKCAVTREQIEKAKSYKEMFREV